MLVCQVRVIKRSDRVGGGGMLCSVQYTLCVCKRGSMLD